MNDEDRRMSAGEADASPSLFPRATMSHMSQRQRIMSEEVETREELSRAITGDSESSSGTSARGSSVRPDFSTMRTQSRATSWLSTGTDPERHPTALSRIHTIRSQHSHTIGTSINSRTAARHSRKPLPAFGAGKPYPPLLPDREEFVVEFDGPDDPLHAQNWPLRKKLPVAIVLGYVTLVAAFGSSIFSTATGVVSKVFGISAEVGTLGVSLYVLGFATGPIIWAPSSELYGRKIPILLAMFGFTIFQFAVATAKDIQTIFISRFFAGFFGACPLTCVGAVFADMFNNRQRGLAITVFAMAVFSGPLFAPFIGGFITTSYLGWRWTGYLTGIMGALALVLALIFLEETYPPVILVNKAADLRRRTKNWGIHAKQEEIEVDFRELIEKNLSRPMRMLFTEPIILLLSVYMAFIYGLLYLFLTFYPIVFEGIHGFSQGVAGLTFFGIISGEMCAGIYMLIIQPSYNRKLAANNNMPIPEWRMPPVIIGGTFFGLGLLWFGWTGYRQDIIWVAPVLSGLFTGFGIMTIFLNCLSYLIDSYLMFSASAIAANTFLRSLAGAGFPLFARQMIEGMGVQWAGTLLGIFALCLVPMPVFFLLRGEKIRARSKFAPTFSIANQASDSPTDSDPEKDDHERRDS